MFDIKCVFFIVSICMMGITFIHQCDGSSVHRIKLNNKRLIITDTIALLGRWYDKNKNPHIGPSMTLPALTSFQSTAVLKFSNSTTVHVALGPNPKCSAKIDYGAGPVYYSVELYEEGKYSVSDRLHYGRMNIETTAPVSVDIGKEVWKLQNGLDKNKTYTMVFWRSTEAIGDDDCSASGGFVPTTLLNFQLDIGGIHTKPDSNFIYSTATKIKYIAYGDSITAGYVNVAPDEINGTIMTGGDKEVWTGWEDGQQTYGWYLAGMLGTRDTINIAETGIGVVVDSWGGSNINDMMPAIWNCINVRPGDAGSKVKCDKWDFSQSQLSSPVEKMIVSINLGTNDYDSGSPPGGRTKFVNDYKKMVQDIYTNSGMSKNSIYIFCIQPIIAQCDADFTPAQKDVSKACANTGFDNVFTVVTGTSEWLKCPDDYAFAKHDDGNDTHPKAAGAQKFAKKICETIKTMSDVPIEIKDILDCDIEFPPVQWPYAYSKNYFPKTKATPWPKDKIKL